MKARARIWILAGLVGLAGAAFGVWQLAAQEPGEELISPKDIPKEVLDNAPEAPPGATIPAIGGHPPPDVLQPTATADLRSAVGPEQATRQLGEIPGVRHVLAAIADKDVDALLALIDWQPTRCGSPHGSTDLCPDGIATGTELPMVDVGSSVPLWVTAETLRPSLAEVLAGEPLALVFASRTREAPYAYPKRELDDGYWLALAGAARPVSPSFMWGRSTSLTGIFLVLETDSETPVIGLTALHEEGSAMAHAYLWSRDHDLHGHEIITFNPR